MNIIFEIVHKIIIKIKLPVCVYIYTTYINNINISLIHLKKHNIYSIHITTTTTITTTTNSTTTTLTTSTNTTISSIIMVL